MECNLWSPSFVLAHCRQIRYFGWFAWWGSTWLLGTKVPWSDSPGMRGGPWAPSTLVKAVLSCYLLLSLLLGPCLGHQKRSVALGFLYKFGCPLSFGPMCVCVCVFFCLVLIWGPWEHLGRQDPGGLTDDRILERILGTNFWFLVSVVSFCCLL